jgi:hypothetical protein
MAKTTDPRTALGAVLSAGATELCPRQPRPPASRQPSLPLTSELSIFGAGARS